MTKEQFISLTIDYLCGGDSTPEQRKRFHPAIIEKHIGVAFNTVVNETHENAVKYSDYGQLDTFTKTYYADVLKDTTADEYYCILPIAPIKLYKNRGVRSVYPSQDKSQPYIYTENSSSAIYTELECDNVQDRAGYEIEGNKIIFSKHFNPLVTNVAMKLIVPFESLDDEDEVSIPAGQDEMIFEMVAGLLLKKPAADTINDNNENSK